MASYNGHYAPANSGSIYHQSGYNTLTLGALDKLLLSLPKHFHPEAAYLPFCFTNIQTRHSLRLPVIEAYREYDRSPLSDSVLSDRPKRSSLFHGTETR